MGKFFTLILFISTVANGQTNSSFLTDYYRNGKVSSRLWQININTIEQQLFFKNGKLKDSMRYIHNQGVGKRLIYRGNGTKFMEIDYGFDLDNLSAYTIFRTDGSIKETGMYKDNKGFGLIKYYSKSGKVFKTEDFNKGKPIKGKNILSAMNTKESTDFVDPVKRSQIFKIRDSKGISKNLKLKKGKLISLRLKNTATTLDHCLVTGFREGVILVKVFEYDNSDSIDLLKFVGDQEIVLQNIESLRFLAISPEFLNLI